MKKNTINEKLNNQVFISSVKKACLLYSDYTMATDPADKDALLELLATYIYKLDNHKAILIYSKVCDSSETEKEVYVEILGDLLSNISANAQVA